MLPDARRCSEQLRDRLAAVLRAQLRVARWRATSFRSPHFPGEVPYSRHYAYEHVLLDNLEQARQHAIRRALVDNLEYGL